MTDSLTTKYDPSTVESRWYACWEDAGLFEPEGTGEPYTITIPPPNITGSLHMGHALCYSAHDVFARYYRLRGRRVNIIPGQDHAGIATQSVVIKQLKGEGINPAELGREAFIERVWQWREESGSTILNQFRLLGCSFNWSQSRFTMDEAYTDAVLNVFVDWFERGLIYRGERVINWDPVLRTSVSDIETERKLTNGTLYHVRYPYADGSGEIIIATTRPETMLGDVAVAVHPDDRRYHGKVGAKLMVPLVGREIPLIEDEYPDPEFGTGAVKITPAHDANDFEVGVRHNLEMPIVLDDRARVQLEGSPYHGLDRYEARKRIVADLEAGGFLVKTEPHQIALTLSDRSKEAIEPLLSKQWFVKQTALAEPAIQAVESGDINFHPTRFAEVYLDWLRNIRDWCISRQLWWGHRIPVYYTEDETPIAARSWEEAERKAGRPIVRQEDDVLDTWFSSGLWPFATQGWPQTPTGELAHYPTSLLITARDIIYLWVARMAMMSLDLTQQIPFKDVFIYATVLTEDGKRMSKSLGTGVDPLEIIEDKGADALRWTLLSQTGSNQEIRYSEKRTQEARAFCNKIWNSARFCLMQLEGEVPEPTSDLNEFDRWLLQSLEDCRQEVEQGLESFDLMRSCRALYDFWWNRFCDWYIEVSKPRMADPATAPATGYVLYTALSRFLALLHPFMPHITEEIASRLPGRPDGEMLMASAWPSPLELGDTAEAVRKVERWTEWVRTARSLRAELGLTPLKSAPVLYVKGDIEGGDSILQTQAWFDRLEFGEPNEATVGATLHGVDLAIPIAGLVDIDQECDRLDREHEKLTKELEKLEKRLANPDFVTRAKPEVVEKERENAAELTTRLEKNRERYRLFRG